MDARQISREGLRIAIGLPSAVMLVIGGMVGVGIFVNPAVVARSLHSDVLILLAWTLGGAVAILGALVYAELAARIPDTGGEYAYLRETFGPLAGFLFGWTTLLVVQAGGMAAVAIVFAKNLNVLLETHLNEGAVVVAVLAGLAGVNCLGVASGNGVQAGLGLLRLATLAVLIIAGLLILPPAAAPRGLSKPPPVDALKSFGAAIIPVVFSYGGWQTANYVAGEMKSPRRTLGLALMLGVLAVILLYLLVNVVCLRGLGVVALGQTLTPTSDVLRRLAGPAGAALAAAAIALSAIAFLSQSTLTGPRVYFAMAKDGLFFRGIGEVGETSRAPAAAILLQAAWTAVLALSGSYEQILSYVTAMNFLFFGLTALALFVLRRRDRLAGLPEAQDRFRTPGHPWTTALFILASLLVVASSFWAYPINSLIGYAILLIGVPPFLFWRRRRTREAASYP